MLNVPVTEAADYIAVTKGTRTYPWRVLGIVDQDKDLLTNEIVYLLESPSKISDTSWIKPGKVAWDWWNALNLYGVDFQSGRKHGHVQIFHRLRGEISDSVHHSR